MNWVDVLAAVNLILIFGAFFLALGIFLNLGEAKSFTLARGWPYILVAVLIFVIFRVYDFFVEYATTSSSRYFKEGILFFFSLAIFLGLLTQYLAVQEAIESRWK